MTDITDQESRDMLEWARIAFSIKGNQEHEPWVTAARYILDNVDAPEPTLAEELARIAENSPVWTIQNVRDELYAATTRAKQMERDLEEARAEVERLNREQDRLCAQVQGLVRRDGDHNSEVRMLTEERDEARAEVDRLTAGNENLRRTDNYREFKEFLGVQKGAESNAETPNPADVKPGEAWIVECRGERRAAVKDNGIDIPWNTINADGWYLSEDNAGITLISRLVPAPRVITNPEELRALPTGAAIEHDGTTWLRRHIDSHLDFETTNRYGKAVDLVPATVLWEPEA